MSVYAVQGRDSQTIGIINRSSVLPTTIHKQVPDTHIPVLAVWNPTELPRIEGYGPSGYVWNYQAAIFDLLEIVKADRNIA